VQASGTRLRCWGGCCDGLGRRPYRLCGKRVVCDVMAAMPTSATSGTTRSRRQLRTSLGSGVSRLDDARNDVDRSRDSKSPTDTYVEDGMLIAALAGLARSPIPPRRMGLEPGATAPPSRRYAGAVAIIVLTNLD
jgi:hypothetical protein